jgi:hypothetical protein
MLAAHARLRKDPAMTESKLSEDDLAAILERAGLSLAPDQVRDLLPGALIMQGLIERVNSPLPREAEPAVLFTPEKGQ